MVLPALGLGLLLFSMLSCSSHNHKGSASGQGLVQIETDSLIDPAQLKVVWLSPENEPIVLFEKGASTKAMIPRASKDLFEFYLGTTTIGTAGITRTREKNQHDYFFKVYMKPEERDPFIQMRVKGPDSTQGYFVKRYKRDLLGDISREEYYDPNQLKTYETFSNYDRNGELINTNKYEYTYDAWGNKATQEHFSWSPDGELKHRARNTFRHDEKGNMLEMTYTAYDATGVIKTDNTNRYTYNEQGLNIEREFLSYDPAGKLMNHYITEYVYNDKGGAVGEILYDANRRRINMLERTLTPEGALFREVITEYHPDGSVKNRNGREYDEKGKVTREF